VVPDGGVPADGAATQDADRDAGPTGPEQSGEATYYNAEGKGACGIETPADYLVAAINDEQYSKANCGRCVSVTGPKGTVIVRVIDKCPGCDAGDLDLSETAFTKIADKSAGRVKITWRFTTCP
jgi:expansin (peptidoglycan-binding protein)